MKIGLVGCGAIGTEIARAIDSGKIEADLVAVCDHNPATAIALIDSLQHKPIKAGLEELVSLSDLVVEAASQKAVRAIARAALERARADDYERRSLADVDFYREVKKLAQERGSRVYIPSGAISGLDGLKSASIGTIRKVTLTTTKNPKGLKGAPYVLENKIDLEALKEPASIFEGSAAEAVKGLSRQCERCRHAVPRSSGE